MLRYYLVLLFLATCALANPNPEKSGSIGGCLAIPKRALEKADVVKEGSDAASAKECAGQFGPGNIGGYWLAKSKKCFQAKLVVSNGIAIRFENGKQVYKRSITETIKGSTFVTKDQKEVDKTPASKAKFLNQCDLAILLGGKYTCKKFVKNPDATVLICG